VRRAGGRITGGAGKVPAHACAFGKLQTLCGPRRCRKYQNSCRDAVGTEVLQAVRVVHRCRGMVNQYVVLQ